jgi:hypothetical protein
VPRATTTTRERRPTSVTRSGRQDRQRPDPNASSSLKAVRVTRQHRTSRARWTEAAALPSGDASARWSSPTAMLSSPGSSLDDEESACARVEEGHGVHLTKLKAYWPLSDADNY